MNTSIHVHIHTRAYSRMHAHTHTRARTHTHARTHARTHYSLFFYSVVIRSGSVRTDDARREALLSYRQRRREAIPGDGPKTGEARFHPPVHVSYTSVVQCPGSRLLRNAPNISTKLIHFIQHLRQHFLISCYECHSLM